MSVVKQSSPLLKRRKANEPVSAISSAKCILCTDDCEEKQKNLTDEQWAGFRNLANEWSGLEGTYSHVFSGVDWESGPNGYFWHKDCKWKMANRKTLNQARTSFNRMSTSLFIDDLSCDISRIDFPSTRLNTGIIHDKDLCIWCQEGYDEKHPERNEFRTMVQIDTWLKIKASIPYISDLKRRNRLRMFVDSTIDPLAEKVRYHVKCFKKYLKPIYQPTADDDLQNIDIKDVQQLFYNHVNERIFEDGEARTLQSLTRDYERIRLNFGIVSVVKSSHVKPRKTSGN